MIVVLMGVTGSGKTTVGRVLARELGWTFVDADDYHPAANVENAPGGSRLTDEDRRLGSRLSPGASTKHGTASRTWSWPAPPSSTPPGLLASSSGRHSLRLPLRPEDLIKTRLAARTGHFMNPSLLNSQFEILDPPVDAIRVDVSGGPEEITREIRGRLRL